MDWLFNRHFSGYTWKSTYITAYCREKTRHLLTSQGSAMDHIGYEFDALTPPFAVDDSVIGIHLYSMHFTGEQPRVAAHVRNF